MAYIFFIMLSIAFLDLSASQLLNPADVLKTNIMYPNHVVDQLRRFPKKRLSDYHDEQHNNLLHIAVQEMIAKKSSATSMGFKDYADFQGALKPVFRYLAKAGVRINELNDARLAPIFYVYGDEPMNKHRVMYRMPDFADFLEIELQAHPTYFSLEPDIRACKKLLSRIFCCCRSRKKAN